MSTSAPALSKPSAATTLVLASTLMSERLGVEKGAMLSTIKAQCFRGVHPDQVSDAQLAAYVTVAQALELNPLLPGMLYAYPDRNGGIMPMIGPDGIFTLLAGNKEIEGWSTKHETIDEEAACTAIIKHKRLGEITKTVFLGEWKIDSNPNWKTRPRHMLEIRALKQCARQVIHGIPFDEDDRSEILRNVTGTGDDSASSSTDAPAERPKTPARRGGARAATEVVVPQNEQGQSEQSEQKTPDAKVESKAETKAADPVEPAKTAPAKTETQAEAPAGPPDVAPEVNLAGFHGKPWPHTLILRQVKAPKLMMTPAGKPVAVIEATAEGHDGILTFVSFEGLGTRKIDGKDAPTITNTLLADGQVISANVEARLRPGKAGQSRTDVAPALYILSFSQPEQTTADV